MNKRDLRTPDQLEGAVKRAATVTIGSVTGQLVDVTGLGGRYELTLLIGGSRGYFALRPDAVVEVHRAG